METNLTKYELQVPKESKEVIDLLEAVVMKIKAKAPIGEYMDLVDELYAAVDKVGEVSAEIKGAHKGDVLAYLTMKVGNLF